MYAFIKKFEVYLITEKCVSLNTYKAYRKDCLQYADFLQSRSIVFSESTEDTLREFLVYLYECFLTPQSVARKIAALKLFFNYCSEHHAIENKAAFLLLPKLDKVLPVYCSEQEIQVLFETCLQNKSAQAQRTFLMILILYNSGVRVSELCRIALSDIDWYRGTLRVTGKGNKTRIIPLPLPLIQKIKIYIETFKPTHYLFPIKYAKKIKPISRQTVGNHIKSLVAQAALSHKISPHALRHSLATHLLKMGWDLRSLQLLLGHEQITTVQLYTHLDKSDLKKMYQLKHPRA